MDPISEVRARRDVTIAISMRRVEFRETSVKAERAEKEVNAIHEKRGNRRRPIEQRTRR